MGQNKSIQYLLAVFTKALVLRKENVPSSHAANVSSAQDVSHTALNAVLQHGAHTPLPYMISYSESPACRAASPQRCTAMGWGWCWVLGPWCPVDCTVSPGADHLWRILGRNGNVLLHRDNCDMPWPVNLCITPWKFLKLGFWGPLRNVTCQTSHLGKCFFFPRDMRKPDVLLRDTYMKYVDFRRSKTKRKTRNLKGGGQN